MIISKGSVFFQSAKAILHRYLFLIYLAAALVYGSPVFAVAAIHQPVKTKDGLISGTVSHDGEVSIFRGIPYAAPPVGPLRWRDPQPVVSWKGTLEATHFSHNCVQTLTHEMLPWTQEFLAVGDVSENCLYLNIWTPTTTSRDRLPVYVFIHGGAFQSGSGDVAVYDGTNLAKKGIVVVNFNYRLGVLGFLADSELSAESPHHSSGNYGLLDQIAVLNWVKQNISAFGGDPNRVTIGGQSAGAISVDYLEASPLAKGLFRGAVHESGPIITNFPAPTLSEAEQMGAEFVKAKGKKSIQEAREIPWKAILSSPGFFLPDIDGFVLPKDTKQIFSDAAETRVAAIFGFNANDSFGREKAAIFRQQVQATYGSMAAEFLALYPASTDVEARASEATSFRDRILVSTYLWARTHTMQKGPAMYTYLFTRAIPWPEHPDYGAFHTAEVPYFFDNLDKLKRPFQPVDYQIEGETSSYLVNFVKSGNPNGKRLPNWAKFKAVPKATMQLGENMKPAKIADTRREKFWFRYFASPEAKHAPMF